jgi:hypothetical protein
VLTVLIIIVMLVIAGGLTALYREVGLGRDTEDSPSTSKWPFGNLAVGKDVAGFTDDPLTGFLALCTDDVDSLGALYSVAVVAEDWGYPLVVAVGKTLRPNGWTHRVDGLPGNVIQRDMRIEEVSALQPAGLPAVVFVNEGRVLEASLGLDSPSDVAKNFQRCRFGLPR